MPARLDAGRGLCRWQRGVPCRQSFVEYQAQRYRALQPHTSTASNTPLLDATKWQPAVLPTGCESCPPNKKVLLLTDSADVETTSAADHCVVAGEAADTVRSSGAGVTLVGSNGDDTIYAGPDKHVFDGYGRDTIFSFDQNNAVFVTTRLKVPSVSTSRNHRASCAAFAELLRRATPSC